MTVSVQTPISSYTGNGVTTAFSFGYYVGASGDLVVMVDGVVQTLTTHYSLTGIGSGSGGTCTFVTAPASGASVVLYRDTDLLRDTDYQENGELRAAILDADFDRIWLALQEVVTGAKTSPRNVRAPVGESLNELPEASARAGKVLSFNAVTGQPEVVAPTSGTATDLAIQLASTADGEGSELVGFNNSTTQTAGTVGAQLTKGVDPTAYPWLADATGATSAYSDIAAADIVAAAAGKPLVIPPGTFLIDTSYTFTTPVVMMPGAKLETSSSSIYLKFNAGFQAGLHYCLDTDGPTQFLLTEKILPEWFGATGLPANDDTVGLTRAFRACRAGCTSTTGVPGASYGCTTVFLQSTGYYRHNDVPVYCGTTIEGAWGGSINGATLAQISHLAPGLRFVPKNYSVTNSVQNNSVGQNTIRNVRFYSEVSSSASEGLPNCYFMSPSQATTYLSIAGDTAGTVGHIDTQFIGCWFLDGNTCIMADDGMLWVHVRGCHFDVCRRAIQHKGTAKGRVNSYDNVYYGITWGAMDNQSTENTMGVSWESHGDEFKAGNTSNATADYRRALNYNPPVVVAGTSVRVKGSHFRRTDALGTRIGGPIFIKNAEHVDLDVWMKDPDSTNDQKAIAIQDGVEHLRISGSILSESLASYANSRLVQISQSPQTLTDVNLDLAIINTNASSVATGLHGNFVTTGP